MDIYLLQKILRKLDKILTQFVVDSLNLIYYYRAVNIRYTFISIFPYTLIPLYPYTIIKEPNEPHPNR